MSTINVYRTEDVTTVQNVQAWRRLVELLRGDGRPHTKEVADYVEDLITVEVRKLGKVEGLR